MRAKQRAPEGHRTFVFLSPKRDGTLALASSSLLMTGPNNGWSRLVSQFVPRKVIAGLLATSALSAPVVAFAQDATTVDEVVITGQREAQRAAIAVKREAFVVSDVVSADDIG